MASSAHCRSPHDSTPSRDISPFDGYKEDNNHPPRKRHASPQTRHIHGLRVDKAPCLHGAFAASEEKPVQDYKSTRNLANDDKETGIGQKAQNAPVIDERMPFRTGWPAPLPALPVYSSTEYRGTLDIENWAEKLKEIMQIFKRHEIPMKENYAMVYRYNQGTPEAEQKEYILVHAKINHQEDIKRWREATRQIAALLQQHDINNLGIEILDEEMCDSTTGAILSNETQLLQAWTDSIPRILECVSNQHWLSIDLLHRGWAAGQFEAVVVISASDASSADWDQTTLPSLREVLPNDWGMELLYADTIGAAGPRESKEDFLVATSEDLLSASYSVPDKVFMGASCSLIHPDMESGTVGGVIRFQKPASSQYGLTCHHVLIKDCPPDGEEDEKLAHSHEHMAQKRLLVVSPSNFDHIKVERQINEDIPRQKRNLKEFEGYGHTDNIKKTKRILKVLKQDLTEHGKLYRKIGIIYASSGRRSTEKEPPNTNIQGTWESDWCLIETDSQKDLAARPACRSEVEATVYQSISPFCNYNVEKYGRTTGRTKGIISAAPTLLKWREQRSVGLAEDTHKHSSVAMYDKPGSPVQINIPANTQTNSIQTRLCHCVIHHDNSKHFMKGGDSGSFVLLEKHLEVNGKESDKVASIVGLGFGMNEAAKVAYMMPFDVVVQDIEDVTRRKVAQPSYQGEASPSKAEASPS